MGLPEATKVQLVELPALPSSLLGTIGKLIGAEADTALSITDVPIIRELLQGVPASMLLAPGVAQARLPFDIIWE
jgi:hypothetical protein